jgi:prepilin-type N-terminal cleavage/methylation domain-containing protein
MKLPLPPIRRAAAFTLVETLVVVTIMGVLAALILGTFSYAQDKSKRTATEVRMGVITSALELYRNDFGSYPEVASAGETVSIRKLQYEVGGAEMLYQALSGDGTDKILVKTSDGAGSGEASDGTVEGPEAQNVKVRDLKKDMWLNQDGRYFMVDGWGVPFQYVRAVNTTVASTPGGQPPPPATMNPTSYDLWSYGTDTENTSARSIDVKTNTELRQQSEKWIKNWK